MVFTPQSDKILRGTSTGLELWNIKTGEMVKQWHDPIDPSYKPPAGLNVSLLPLAVSDDGKLVAVRSTRDQSAWIFSMEGDEAPLHLLTKCGYHAQFLHDNHTLLLNAEGSLQKWDSRGDGHAPLRVWSNTTGDWSLSPNQQKLAVSPSSSADVSIRNFPDLQEKVQLYLLGEREPYAEPASLDWIALTPDGFYNASSVGEKRLRWRDENDFWPLAKSHAQFYNPAKVQEALQDTP